MSFRSEKKADPFYFSEQWKNLRRYRLLIDKFICAVPGCKEKASVVDHIVSRMDGGRDRLENLRSLCSLHDRQMKEKTNRKRGMNGRLPSLCDENGMPYDPDHPWHRPGGVKKV